MTLDETYTRMLSEISPYSVDYARQMLTLLCCARRPLTVDELIVGVAFQNQQDPQFNSKCILRNENAIQEVCPGFVEIDVDPFSLNRTVRLAHFSVREYLTSGRLAQQTNKSSFCIDLANAERHMACICLTVLLNLKELAEPPFHQLDMSVLAIYAAQYWPDHFRSGRVEPIVEGKALDLFTSSHGAFETWIAIWDADPCGGKTSPGKLVPPLYYASLLGLEVIVVRLVEKGADVNAQGGYYGTALNAASHQGHLAIAQLLLEHGADVNAQGQCTGTALHAASGEGHEKIVQLLLERGACIDMKDSEWKTPLHHAVLNGWKRCVFLLLQRGAILNPDSHNMTPFHYAVNNNNQEVTQIFLDAGIPVDLTVRQRFTAEMFQNGWDRAQSSAQNLALKGSVKVGLTSLHLAALMGCREMTKFLLHRGADPNYASDYGETPLHLALKRELFGPRCPANPDFWKNLDNRLECIFDYLEGEESLSVQLRVDELRLEIIDLLLEESTTNVNAQDTAGVSPLHIVSRGKNASKLMIQKLIGKGARVSMRTNEGETPLHLACSAENIGALTVLLDSGADPTECDEKGANALHYAARHGHRETIRTILAHMPEGTREAFTNSKDKHGKNALHHLFKKFKRIGGVDSLKSLLELSHGVNELDQAGMSPTAIFLKSRAFFQSNEDTEALRLLFGHGADPTFETKQGLNLVHLAAKSGRASNAVLRILANQRVDMRARDKQGRTAFHHGAISGNLTKEALYCLRDEYQLSTDLLDEQGKTPLAYAVEKGQGYHHPYMFDPNRWARIQTLLRE